MQRISVVAAFSDAKLLQDLRTRIARQNDIALLADAQDDAQALRAVGEKSPDVLLLDSAIAGGDRSCTDASLVEAVHHASPRTKIILLADCCSERAVANLFRQGARGCMTPAALADEGLRAIRAVNAGEVWIGRRALASLLDDLLSRLERNDYVASKWADLLSARELEIANGVRLGLTNKQIARKLRISDTTVKTHLENIFQKLNVSRRVQLAVLARGGAQAPGPDDDGGEPHQAEVVGDARHDRPE